MKQRIAMLLAAVALPLSVAACGTDEPAGQSTIRPAQAAATTEKPADETLALGERAVAPFVD